MGANMQKIILSDGYDNKWVQGIIVGFELTRTGNKQKILVRLEDGDLASDLMNNPIKYQNLNQIGKLVGQQPVRVGEEILLPGLKDSDKMGWDSKPVEVKIKESKGYLNIVGWRKVEEPKLPNPAPPIDDTPPY